MKMNISNHPHRTVLFVLLTFILLASANPTFAQETDQAYHARMKWWNDARLGMFLHWGVYSTFQGQYNGIDYGKEMGNASAEWIYLRSNMPQADYRAAAREFNPVNYDPAQWVSMARQAGMKYMVLTSKHHDGFALFDTKASKWNAVEASGIKTDLIKQYVDACHEQGMKVGFYYSHEKDWFHHERSNKNTGPIPDEYVELVKTQIKELLTQYGTIDLIWFDTPVQEHEQFNRMYVELVRKYQPNCIINGRIGNDLGDYKNIGDRAIVNPGGAGYMESIMTMRLNWGYDRNDDYWKTSNDLIKMVSKSACRGSNFLLNIGPTPLGTFPPEDKVRLKNLGDWIKANGQAIYKTKGSPFAFEHIWGSITSNNDTKTVYLHLWNPTGSTITVHGLLSKVETASFLDSGQHLKTTAQPESATLKVELPSYNDNERLRIVKLKLKDSPKFDKNKGPKYTAPKVHHVTSRLIKGRITEINQTYFTIKGIHNISSKQGCETDDDKEIDITFTLNDHVKYRINNKGDIQLVQGYELDKTKQYRIVYTPQKNNPQLEIITQMQ